MRSTYERIRNDPRHNELRLLRVLHAHARSFSDWDKGYAGFRTFKREVVERYSPSGAVECSTMDANKALSLLAELSSATVSPPITV